MSRSTTIMVSNAKIAAMLLLTTSLLAGAGAWTCHAPATPQPPVPQATPSRPTQDRKTESPRQKKEDSIMVTGRALDPDGKPVRGVTARIAVQDADGKPLAGAWASGLTERWPIAFQLPEATATVYALNPDKPRTMAFYHPEKKLGGTATVRGDEKKAVVVKLAPIGKVSGQLLDADGVPLEGVEVSIQAQTEIGRELHRFAAPSGKTVRTDKDGRFRIESVVPNLKFGLNLRKERTFFAGVPRIGMKQVKTGETLDLGAVRVKPAS